MVKLQVLACGSAFLVLEAIPVIGYAKDLDEFTVPIKEVDLSDGTRRYAIELTMGNRTFLAGLDTGSVGLRVLQQYGGSDPVGAPSVRYTYAVGTTFDGPIAKSDVHIGPAVGRIRFQSIQRVSCAANRPMCPAARMGAAEYRIEGNGLRGEGFSAILGVGLSPLDLPNPLAELGIRRWIVDLPRPGEINEGKLILNPTENTLRTFQAIKMKEVGAGRDAVAGCINLSDPAFSMCAPTLLDTGNPGIELVNANLNFLRGPGLRAEMRFEPATGSTPIGFSFLTGDRKQASRLVSISDERVREQRIRSGLIAYFCYDVLYDVEHKGISLHVRQRYSGGMVPSVVRP